MFSNKRRNIPALRITLLYCGALWGVRGQRGRGAASGRPVPRAAAGLLRPRGAQALVLSWKDEGLAAPGRLSNSGDPSKH